MIKSISINSNSIKQSYVFDTDQKHKWSIDITKIKLSELNSFDIEIVFEQSISEFRNHDYTWVKCNEDRISNQFCPKVIKLQNGQLVQANIHAGIWEINKKNKNVLLWRFNPEFAESITTYLGSDNRKKAESSKKRFHFPENPTLLFPENYALEFSRSKYPFTAVACFTDHCDFDTVENLSIQRKFFKETQIKITKGFFLNHFSKRSDNASFENDKEELLKWKNDGHELCYHSLSQSIKSEIERFNDFEQFVPPLTDLKVWIDHGYQPYNFSLLKKNNLTNEKFEKILEGKNINILWNYIDSGTSAEGVVNQLNNQQFTLAGFKKGNKDLGLVKKTQLMIKNIIFHYYNDENMILKYQSTAGNFKKIVFQKKIKFFLPLLKNAFDLGIAIFSIVLSWNRVKNKPYKLAKYSPLVFKHIIHEKEFYVFQTLEMLDFQESLSRFNLDSLVNEKGVFIAHTYFSVPMHYHKGKLFSTSDKIDENVFENFKLLGAKVQNKEIWNPTLSELVEYWKGFETMVLNIDKNGNLFTEINSDLHSKKIN
ncbi:hypothetical protein [Flavobacterium chungbukense]|uniref:NodB homology domain-containing protein n=1 Tax=Flavobacterium chungbukense TaxID=877464 RepID=A0ABP7XKZ8_9FLAO|nr:hypothetical protein [Flavobacterium chungbukense]MCC4922925.1 hypothetical protein [Flavobacterium chungbukense]